MGKYRNAGEPCPYTGVYDKEGNRWVKALKGRRSYSILYVLEID